MIGMNPERWDFWYSDSQGNALVDKAFMSQLDILRQEGFNIKLVTEDELEEKEDSVPWQGRFKDERILSHGIDCLYVRMGV